MYKGRLMQMGKQNETDNYQEAVIYKRSNGAMANLTPILEVPF